MPAKGFRGVMTREALVEGRGPWRGEDVLQGCVEKVAQRHGAVVVQAAGDYGTVREHSYLVAQGITEDFLCRVLGAMLPGPFEDVVVFQIYALGQAPPVVASRPGAWHVFGGKVQEMCVGRIKASLVPEPQHYDHAAPGCLKGKGHDTVHVLAGGTQGVALVGMKGYLHLVRTGLQHSTAGPVQEGAVGGDDGEEAFLAGHGDEAWEKGVQEGLAHEMEVEEPDTAAQAVREQVILGEGEGTCLAAGLGAEDAVKVAYVGYLEITARDDPRLGLYDVLLHGVSTLLRTGISPPR